MGGVDDGESSLSDSVVRSVVWDARQSHDEIQKFPERLNKRNFERRDRARKSVTSTEKTPPFRQMIDFIFSF